MNITAKILMQSTLTLALASLVGCGGNSDNTTVVTPVTKSSLAIIGDMPYGLTPTDTAQFLVEPTFISAINADTDVSAVLHVGDIHSGKEYCTESYNRSVFGLLAAFKTPLIYTPGDNEWADCHKVKEGGGTYNATTGQVVYSVNASGKMIDYEGGDPVKNLALVRSIFFANPGKTLGNSMDVHSQAKEFDSAYPADGAYVENVWFEKSNVLFVTLNMPGGSNNDTDPWYGAPTMSSTQSAEVVARSAANKRWLDVAFKKAIANADVGVVIQLQADMWDTDGSTAAHIAEYKQFIDAIATNAKAFNKPVLLLNGDSHTYRSDNPLVAGAPCLIEPSSGAPAVVCSSSNVGSNPVDPYTNQPNGYNVPNFHRIVVHGSTLPLEYLKLSIDPSVNATSTEGAFGPFTWTRVKPSSL